MNFGLKQIITDLVKNPTKIITIADAWITAANPTLKQKELAEARWNMCVLCDEFREKRPVTGEPFCNNCGCPLKKKIFTRTYNECPLGKWKELDDASDLVFTKKDNKTII